MNSRPCRHPYLGLIGNGETAALIAPNLDIAWFCPGRFDAFPLFASALDPKHGGKLELGFKLQPSGPVNLKTPGAASAGPFSFQATCASRPGRQRYLDDTNILHTMVPLTPETTAAEEEAEVCVEVFDYFPWRKPYLVRDIKLCNRTEAAVTVHVSWNIRPIAVGAYPVQLGREDHIPVATSSHWSVAFGLADQPAITVPARGVIWTRFVLAYAGGAPEAASRWREAVASGSKQGEPAELLEARRFWATWLNGARSGRLRWASSSPATGVNLESAYRRSLLALKLLVYEPTGAIIAAPTASFPATPGGTDNWDYRHVWLRDGYLCALAFDEAGLTREARRFYDFAFSLQADDGSWPNPLVDLHGNLPEETIVAELEGPGGEKPIRFGNAALRQLQLDNTGNVVDGLWRHYLATRDLDYIRGRWPAVLRALRWLETNWRRPENGIWEFRDAARQWVYGKAMCFAAFRAGSAIASVLGYDEEGRRWEEEAAIIRDEVISRGWQPERQAFVQFYGSPEPLPDNDGAGHPPKAAGDGPPLDISVLALAFYGLLDPTDPRMMATARAIEKPASHGGLNIDGGIARFEGAALPFYLPTLWLARFYLLAGNERRAVELLLTCLSCATDLDLMSEHFEPATGRQWGNFPQAFSHEEFVRTVLALARRHSGRSRLIG